MKGGAAETRAAEALEARGWRLLARNFRIRGGEIDVIAERDGVIAFVEVKARPSRAAAAAAITGAQRRRLARAVAVWLSRNPRAVEGGYVLRGDAVLVDAGDALHHIEDAFALDAEDLNAWA